MCELTKDNLRIYFVDAIINYDFDTSPLTWTDEKFISEAEIQGNVYSVEGFVEAFNNDVIFSDCGFIRILPKPDCSSEKTEV